MAHELEYVVDNALLDCSEGTVPMFFHPTPRNIRVQGLKVANASDKVPIVNIPSFVICKKLTQQAGGTPVPCVPVPQTWQDTYPVQINKEELLVYRSCIKCTSGQGTIEFMSSGQTPLSAEMLAQLQQMQQESDDLLKQAEAEQNAVGETGFWEGMIPVWGSGRDMINAIQTGDVGGAILNGGFLVWDVASIVVGVFSFGAGTVAMQGVKAGAKGLLKTGLKSAGKELLQKAGQQLAKSVFSKQALNDAILRLTKGRVCVLACFPAGTPVAVEGGQKNIEDIEAGDRVWSRHEETGELALKRVVTTMQRESDHLVHLRLGGERIATTVEHPFWVADRGWVKAGELRMGDGVLRANGVAAPVTEIEHQTEFEGDELPLVYNIEVAEWHNYLVGKWLWWVHNNRVCREAAEAAAKELLEGELKTGTYKNLIKAGKRGDNLTPHHMPSNKYMGKNGGKNYSRNDGVSINVEQPPTGGRHRSTKTFGKNMTDAQREAYYKMNPSEALKHDVDDLREIYKKDGLYNEKVEEALQDIIKQNKEKYPDVFK